MPCLKIILNGTFKQTGRPRTGCQAPLILKQAKPHLYLATVIGLADRKAVGWALSETMKASDTTVAAFKMAAGNRPMVQPLLFHSDRGIQYACSGFTGQLKNGLLNKAWVEKATAGTMP